jgi:hypothetical protein
MEKAMTEKMLKENLHFLVNNYRMRYDFQEFKGFYGGNNSLYIYSYYNENGCFTIKDYPVVSDVTYIRLDNIESLGDYLTAHYDEQIKHEIHIFHEEPEIWKKHEKKQFLKFLLYWNSEKTLKALAEVILTQIEKYGEFFGIKVDG